MDCLSRHIERLAGYRKRGFRRQYPFRESELPRRKAHPGRDGKRAQGEDEMTAPDNGKYGDKAQTSRIYKTVTLPAGASSFNLAAVREILNTI
jgi:hypothetical protein